MWTVDTGTDRDGDSCLRGCMGTGTILKSVAGIRVGIGIRVLGRASLSPLVALFPMVYC